ncbi:MAG: type II/IV secretion system protein [Candidatus Riflebacteria bacterium]|nr:type II/IV secretion system protein [Candidatus Riflebacteria bacterium]
MSVQAGKKSIDQLMLDKKLLSEEQLEKAKNIQAQTLERLEDILVRLGFLTEKEILDLWAEFLGVSVIDLTSIKVDAKILSMIPEYQAKQYKAIPLRRNGNKLVVAMADPFDIMAIDMIAFLTQSKLEIVIASKSQLDLAVKQWYSWEGFSVAGEENFVDREDGIELARKTSEEGPVVQFLNAIFKQAILKRASDIHVEPREDILLIRLRIDGILHDAMTGPKSLLAPLISRIKILAHLDIAERRLPQDGRLKVKMEDKEVDFRVSTVPSLVGEKAVLRLLQRESAFDLDNLGIPSDDLERMKQVLDEPYGMILVTGPTGSGKTTTLFGMLKYFNSAEINIFTIEDPVEYRINGITQVQTNEKINFGFSEGLRAALRQDPDIILVGEIRDLDTADIAFRASLTGHKVLSTLHTNNAPGSVNRLINMGVPAYLVTAALRVVIGQKLLHRICPHCKTEYRPSHKTIQRLKLPASKIAAQKFFKGIGCRECNQSGAFGRIGVYETMVVGPTVRDVIMDGNGETVIKRVARLNGMKTMRELGLLKAFEGITTLEEVLFDTAPDEEISSNSISTGSLNRSQTPTHFSESTSRISSEISSGISPDGYPENQPQRQVGIIDPNDPVFKAILSKVEEDFFFFAEEELASRFHINLSQVQECIKFLGLEPKIEHFSRKLGKNPENMSDDEIEHFVQKTREKQGKIPLFIFQNPGLAKRFVKIMVEHVLKTIPDLEGKPSKLPEIFSEDFCREHGLDVLYEWIDGGRFGLIQLARPGEFKPWQFGEAQRWLKSANLDKLAQEAIEWFMTVKLGCGKNELPMALSADGFKENGLEELFKQFDKSVFKMMQTVFPGYFQPWQFPEEESVLWFREDKLEVASAATHWLLEKVLNIRLEEIPKRITNKDFHQHGLGKLPDLFNQNLYKIIENAYPSQFKPWEFSEQENLWKSPDALKIATEAVNWLVSERLQWDPETAISQITRRHFLNHDLGFMLGCLFNHSPLVALENTFPKLKTDEIFCKALLNYSQEVREILIKWLSLSEKIAVTQFGKSRFKASLSNLKIAPIIPENDRIYFNHSNQIEYVPQIIVPKLSAFDDFSDFTGFVPCCDKLLYWILADDRTPGYLPPSHPKVKLVFSDAISATLRGKGLLDVVEKVHLIKNQFERLLDRKAPLHT